MLKDGRAVFVSVRLHAEIRCQARREERAFGPPFWMMKWTRNWDDVVWPPEIDIFQASSRINNQYYPAVLSGPKKKPIEVGRSSSRRASSALSQGMHTYGFEWTQQKMTCYFDGKRVRQQPSPVGTDARLYLMLSLAGGR